MRYTLSIEDDLTIALVYNSETKVFRGVSQDILAIKSTSDTADAIYRGLDSLGFHVARIKINGSLNSLNRELVKLDPKKTLVFNLCDGFKGVVTAQAHVTHIIDSLSFAQTGSTSETVNKCVNKALTKQTLVSAGLPTPPYQIFEHAEGVVGLKFPVNVKPLYEDGSVGINLDSVAQTRADMFRQIDYILTNYKQPALVEEFIQGRELSVSLWGNEQLEALPIVEHDFSHISDPNAHLLTYQSKWVPDFYAAHKIIWKCPAVLSAPVKESVLRTAMAAYRAMGLRDLGRIDFRYFNGIPYILDINEIPDLDPEAGFAQSAKVGGYSYPGMIQKIIDIALRRVNLLCLAQTIAS